MSEVEGLRFWDLSFEGLKLAWRGLGSKFKNFSSSSGFRFHDSSFPVLGYEMLSFQVLGFYGFRVLGFLFCTCLLQLFMEFVEVCVQSLDIQIHLMTSHHGDDVSGEWGGEREKCEKWGGKESWMQEKRLDWSE